MESLSRVRLEPQTERLQLRPWTTGDTSWHRCLAGERRGEAATVEAEAEVIASVVAAQSDHGVVPSVVVRKLDGEILGYCGLVIGKGTIGEPELAYELFQHAHGRGYATEAARAVIDAAKQTGRSRLWSTVRIWNGPSFRVLEKLGFTRHHSVWDGDGELVWNMLKLR
ncbi:GNAT family N-acetyltransferase [Arthrobacter sp. ISL-48]|uniref:GNAT family N-acetyltransferase n=1 Tax=Arthrobacter sp. ISL-48 TaxID=2819110 RepID=UPI001BEAC8C1|nr:GNAT family N-acetyltransferase [Arthrobacter sp. ISL-48]MBT2533382.1 GNAT family N-acetyltransferase [Arthrobacter sp. ISL-48]